MERRIRIRLKDLDALPFIFRKLLAVLDKPYPSPREIGEVIAADPSLSLRVLRMVNSASMAPRQPVISVSQAVALLGINTVRSVSLCLVSYDSFFAGAGEQQKELWKHCLICALLARNLACRCKRPDHEEMFVAGLLHDLGLSVLAKDFPKENIALQKAYRSDRHPCQTEKEILGVDHAEIGYWASEYWKLPELVGQCILHHHTPQEAGKYRQPASLIHLADCLGLQAWHPDSPELQFLQIDCVQSLGLQPGELTTIVAESQKQLLEIENFVSGDLERRQSVRAS